MRHEEQVPALLPAELLPRRGPAARVVVGIARGSWWVVRNALLVVLVTLQGPVDFLLRMATFASLIGLAVAFLMTPAEPRQGMLILFAVTAVSSTGLRIAYRAALARLRWVA